ncbi:hypothetical protein AAGG52_01885 [Bacillus licheniformis]
MRNKNIFENENVKLRLINLEYSYKERFASENAKEVKKLKRTLSLMYAESLKKKQIKNFPKI